MKLVPDFSDKSYLYTHFPSTSARMLFYYPLMVGYEECGKNYFLERDDFNDYLILYTISGSAQLEYRGKKHSVKEGDCIFIYCNEHHMYRVTNEPWITTWMHFSGNSVKQYFEKIFIHSGPVIKLGNNTKIPKNIAKIIQMIKRNSNKTEITSSLLILELLTELMLISNFGLDENDIPEEINEVVAFINNNYKESISLDTLAKITRQSKFYLAHNFKKYIGYSLHEYIIKCKLEESKNLLITTNLSISEIAEKTGFDTSSNFTRLFKGKIGYTPLKYRKSRYLQAQIHKVNYDKSLSKLDATEF